MWKPRLAEFERLKKVLNSLVYFMKENQDDTKSLAK